jgi:hypothetical protein
MGAGMNKIDEDIRQAEEKLRKATEARHNYEAYISGARHDENVANQELQELRAARDGLAFDETQRAASGPGKGPAHAGQDERGGVTEEGQDTGRDRKDS